MAEPLPTDPPLVVPSIAIPEPSTAVDTTDDGVDIVRDIHGGVRRFRLELHWGALTTVETMTLLDFFNTHRAGEISVTLDGNTYTCRLVAPPRPSRFNGARLNLEAILRGTLDV